MSGHPDAAPPGLDKNFGGVSPHGWLAMGYMTSPATRAASQRCIILAPMPPAPLPQGGRGALTLLPSPPFGGEGGSLRRSHQPRRDG